MLVRRDLHDPLPDLAGDQRRGMLRVPSFLKRTGKQKLVDTAGRVERFNKKYRRAEKSK